MSIYALFQVIREIILMELKMHRQSLRIHHSINAIHPKFVARVICKHTNDLDVILLIYKASGVQVPIDHRVTAPQKRHF